MKEVILITGTNRAGKDTTGNYIGKQLVRPVLQISSPLRQLCVERGIQATRENLIALGTELSAISDGYLAEYILRQSPDKFVLTGARQLGQLAILRQKTELTIIAVDAAPAIRYARSPDEAPTLEEFISREIAENSAPNAQRVFECMEQADYRLVNEGTPTELFTEIDDILADITRP